MPLRIVPPKLLVGKRYKEIADALASIQKAKAGSSFFWDLGKGEKAPQVKKVALDRKYSNAPSEWCWQWVFPHENRWTNAMTKE